MGWFFKKKKFKEELKEPSLEEELEIVLTFLKEIEVRELIRKLKKMKEMVAEGRVIKEELKKENLKKQITFFQEILREYSFFEDDTVINRLRLIKVGQRILAQAKELGLKDIVKEKKKDFFWR